MGDYIRSYPKIYNLGHAAIAALFDGPVVVEEKVDGSQFNFGVYSGELRCRSKGCAQDPDGPDKMFQQAVDTAKALAPRLSDGWTYRAEYLSKPHHNSLAYDRVPKQNLILFDIDTGLEAYESPGEKAEEAEMLGLECVPVLLYAGKIKDFEQFKQLLNTDSVLGGQKVEGLVIKNYGQFGRDGKVLMGKYVSEAFREVHEKQWKVKNPGGSDIKFGIGSALATPLHARWEKAVQHLRERGELTETVRDIGPLLKEICVDTAEECGDEIKAKLFKWAWKDISRLITRGFVDWYKERLAQSHFAKEPEHAGMGLDTEGL